MKSKSRQIIGKYVQDRLARESAPHGAVSEIARRLGTSHAHVSKIASGKGGVSYDFEVKLAALWGMTYPGLEDTALKWWEAQPKPLRLVPSPVHAPPAPPDRYPDRARAREAAVILGYHPEALAEVDAIVLRAAVNPTADQWLDQYRAAHLRCQIRAASPDADDAEVNAHTNALIDAGKPKLPGQE